MKYFLASVLLVCMYSVAAEQKSSVEVALGTLEMFSDWYLADEDVDLNTMCENVARNYNQINENRGYRGRQMDVLPVRSVYRRGADGSLQRRFFCQLRVFKSLVL